MLVDGITLPSPQILRERDSRRDPRRASDRLVLIAAGPTNRRPILAVEVKPSHRPVDLGVAKRTMLDTTKYGPNALGSLVRFGLLALVPLIALGVVLAHELNVDLQQRYLETARTSATLITQVGIQPLLSGQQVQDGMSFTDVATIDDKLQGAAVSKDVRRIKVWNKNGTVVYSDNPALIGRTFLPDDDLRAALSGHSSASITNGHDEENSGDNLAGPLIQVYVPLVFAGTSSAAGAFEL